MLVLPMYSTLATDVHLQTIFDANDDDENAAWEQRIALTETQSNKV